jgi:DNA mismatch repair protein MutS2
MSARRFREGDFVFVTKLRRSGVVVALLANESYRIAISSITIVCKEGELSPSNEAPPHKDPIPAHLRGRTPKPSDSLDLHGLSVDDATRKLETWLSEVIMAGMDQVTIVHGLGSGRLQTATHALLKRIPSIRAFRVSDSNPGETRVYL